MATLTLFLILYTTYKALKDSIFLDWENTFIF
jgi:hypothetical protein